MQKISENILEFGDYDRYCEKFFGRRVWMEELGDSIRASVILYRVSVFAYK